MNKDNKFLGYDSYFATRLRDLMIEKKVTQKELADSVGVSRQAISQYMDGSAQPNLDKFVKMAEFFNVSTDYMVGNTDIRLVDTTDIAINKQLGLSAKSIGILKEDVEWLYGKMGKGAPDELAKRFAKEDKDFTAPACYSINTILEEERSSGEDPIFELLSDFFSRPIDNNPNVIYFLEGIKQDHVLNKVEEVNVDQVSVLNHNDILAIKLLKIQQALMRLKTKLDDKELSKN